MEDLFTDLCDGRLLINLLEIISGEKLGKIGMKLFRPILFLQLVVYSVIFHLALIEYS